MHASIPRRAPIVRSLAIAAGACVLIGGTSLARSTSSALAPPPRTLTVLANTAASKNDNFRARGGKFSVVFTQSPAATFHLYATGGYHGWKWKLPQQELRGLYGQSECSPTGPCYYKKDPRDRERRCSTDAIHYLWKRVPCATRTVACQNNDRWNAWPGRYNVTTFPTIGIWPVSMVGGWRTDGHAALIDHTTVNAVQLQAAGANCQIGSAYCPPKTGLAGQATPPGCGVCPNETPCAGARPYNPDEWATGAANSKMVEHRYANGSTRWFMAFNSMIHFDGTSSDVSRILWATSPDGASRTVHPNILFRSVSETVYAGGGFLVTDMFTDEDRFYVVFTDVGSDFSYLVRSAIHPNNVSTNPGYTTWEIAVGTTSYAWQPISIGGQQNFGGFAARLFDPGPSPFAVRQASIGRVFDSATPGSASRYIAITNLQSTPQLWSTPNLSTAFTFDSNVVLDPSIQKGAFGWEFGFTHYADNTPQTPRIVKSGFHLWIVEDCSAGVTTGPTSGRGLTARALRATRARAASGAAPHSTRRTACGVRDGHRATGTALARLARSNRTCKRRTNRLAIATRTTRRRAG